MCCLCIEIAKGHITYKEALRNIQEMIDVSKSKIDAAHLGILSYDLIEKERKAIESGGSSDDKIERVKWI